MNTALINGKNVKWVYDVNVEGLQVPAAFMAKITATYNTCQVKDNYLVCKCKGDLSKLPDLSVKFSGHDQYWTMQKGHFTTVKNVKDFDNNACVTTLW